MGKIDEFDSATEEWKQYEERLGHFFSANGIDKDEKKRAVLLTLIGPTTYKLLSNLIAPQKPGGVEYSSLVKTLADHFSPTPSEIVQRFKFNSRSRRQGESVATFVAELRAIAAWCNFGETLEAMLRDRIVCGINDSTIQKRLLAESKLTYQQELDLARGLETAAKNVKELRTPHGHDAGPKAEEVLKVTSAAGKANDGVTSGCPTKTEVSCYRCGKPGHLASRCKVSRSIICHGCGKRGHLKKACKGRGRQAGTRTQTHPHSVRHVCDEAEVTDTEDAPIFHVRVDQKTPPYQVTVEADGCSLRMEVDTGSSVSLIWQATFNKLWPARQLSTCHYRLRSYANSPITVLGCFESEVHYKSQVAKLPLIMVEGSGPSLLGRNWLEHIVLDWREIHHISTTSLQSVLEKHHRVFQKDLGTMNNFQAKIYVNSTAKPQFCKARTVPFAMQEKVEKELQRLVNEGTLEPVQSSDWAAPIVPVLKADKHLYFVGLKFREKLFLTFSLK